MILTVRFKVKLYRRFEKDIWGLFLVWLSAKNKFSEFFNKWFLLKKAKERHLRKGFVYDTVFIFGRKDRKAIKWRFLSLRLMRLYYIILSYRQLRSIAKWAGRSDGFFQTNFCYRLEGRAYALIYRTNMVTSMFTAIYLVETANVLVNKDLKVKPNTLMKIGDLLSFFETNFLFFRANFFSRIDSRGIYFSTPRYLFYSYKLNVFSMLALPQDRDLAFPMEFDIYRVSGYY